MASDKLGVGIIGTGVIFDSHATALQHLQSQAQLIAISDVDKNKLQQAGSKFFAPFSYDEYGKMLERTDIDVVVVCTPPHLHEEMVRHSLEAGKFVICEKPLACTLEAADRIVQLSQAHPDRLSVVFQLRYLPDIRRMLWLRDEGHLGELRFGHVRRYGRLRGSSGAMSGWWGNWAVAGGGAGMTQFIHELDLLLQVFGPAATVKATIATLKEPIESEDTLIATIRFTSGALVTVFCTVAAQENTSAFEVIGEKGSVAMPWTLHMENEESLSTVRRTLNQRFPNTLGRDKSFRARVVRKLRKELKIGVAAVRNSHLPYLQETLRAMRDGQALPSAADEARASIELCTAIYASGLTEQSISFPLDSSAPFYRGITTDDYNPKREVPFATL